VDYTLNLTDVADAAVREAILEPLVAYNNAKAGNSEYTPLVLTINDSQGQVIGGLWGGTSYRWLFVELLFVPESLRGKGLGMDLLHRAEREAAARGCRGAWLDTYEFQARGFYERLGYRCFGELVDCPPGCSRYFMKKALE
jgi:GNAT superfamily N-acetyltransferase